MPEIVLIHYLGFSSKYDEAVDLKNSNRIASLGFYTMRQGIPMYKMSNKLNKNDNYVANLNIPKNSGTGYNKLKTYAHPELNTCEDFYIYENSKISD